MPLLPPRPPLWQTIPDVVAGGVFFTTGECQDEIEKLIANNRAIFI